MYVLKAGDKMLLKVCVYEEEFYIDKETGEGFGGVLEKIKPYITSLSYSWNKTIPNTTQEDLEQDIYVIAIQGIKNYNPSKNTKLSSFLHTHINNKLISKKTSEFKKSKNASYLETESFTVEILKDSFSEEDFNFNRTFGFQKEYSENEFKIFLEDLKDSIEYKTWMLIKNICQKDMTIKEASEEMGMTFWEAKKRINALSKNKSIVDAYERQS